MFTGFQLYVEGESGGLQLDRELVAEPPAHHNRLDAVGVRQRRGVRAVHTDHDVLHRRGPSATSTTRSGGRSYGGRATSGSCSAATSSPAARRLREPAAPVGAPAGADPPPVLLIRSRVPEHSTRSTSRGTARISVVGVGNMLYRDEGVGVYAARYLQRAYRFHPRSTWRTEPAGVRVDRLLRGRLDRHRARRAARRCRPGRDLPAPDGEARSTSGPTLARRRTRSIRSTC